MKHTKLTRLTLATTLTLTLLAPLGAAPANAHTTSTFSKQQAAQQHVNQTWPQQRSIPKPATQDPDTDGDGLSDKIETEGYDANGDGKPEVDYKKLGADPKHKDLFIEMDYMPGELASEEELDRIVDTFKALKVDNPDGKEGINLHLDAGNARSQKYNLGGGNQIQHQALNSDLSENGSFATIRNKNFDVNRKNSGFDYMIWGDYQVDQTGNRNSSGLGFVGAPGFMVTVGKSYWNDSKGNMSDIRVGTFIHELGHNLGLQHGGADDVNGKPQYYSIMNYRYQLTGIPKADGSKTFGYLQEDMPTLDEQNLDERAGFGQQAKGYIYTYKNHYGKDVSVPADQPIDFNRNGRIDSTSVAVDLNGGGLSKLTAESDLKHLNLAMKPGQAGAPQAEAQSHGRSATVDEARTLGLIQ